MTSPAERKAALTKWKRQQAQRNRRKREAYERTREGQWGVWDRKMKKLTQAFQEAVEILKGAKP